MKTVVFDIETIPQSEDVLMALAPEFKPAANLKDPEKIAASIAQKRAEYIADAALDWKTAHVAMVGFHDGVNFDYFAGNEANVVKGSLELIESLISENVSIGGHNIKGFDFPMLVNRARVLRINVPENLVTFRTGRAYWSDKIFDTLELVTFGNKQNIAGNGCDALARVFGLPGKLGGGGDFPQLWKSNRQAAIDYNQRDCEIEIQLARIFGF